MAATLYMEFSKYDNEPLLMILSQGSPHWELYYFFKDLFEKKHKQASGAEGETPSSRIPAKR